MRQNAKVDVIIPAYKPKESYIKLIEMLEKQTYPVNRIIVINTEEKYYTELMYGQVLDKTFDNIHVSHISKREFNHARTRRDGVERSDADIFVCMTDDAVPKDEFLIENLISPLLSNKACVSYARQIAKKDSDEIEKFTRNFNYPRKSRLKSAADMEQLGIKTYFCSNVCAAYNREVYDRLGGFEEYAIFNEDMVYAAKAVKAGYKIAYTASAEVIHSHDYNAVQLFKRNFDMGVSQAEHPEIFKRISSTSEGKKLVAQTIEHLKKRKKAYLIPKLVFNSTVKYLGYRLGVMYEYLPKWFVKKCSSMPEYWVGRDVYENNRKINYHSGYGINATERVDGRRIHKASQMDDTYRGDGYKSTLKDEIKVRPKDKMIDRSHAIGTNKEVAWKNNDVNDEYRRSTATLKEMRGFRELSDGKNNNTEKNKSTDIKSETDIKKNTDIRKETAAKKETDFKNDIEIKKDTEKQDSKNVSNITEDKISEAETTDKVDIKEALNNES